MAKKTNPHVGTSAVDRETRELIERTLDTAINRLAQVRNLFEDEYAADDRDETPMPPGWEAIVRSDLETVRLLLDAVERTTGT